MTGSFDPDLHQIHRAQVGSNNPLPPAPPGRTLCRVWRVLDADRMKELGPVHNRTAFLEDEGHDWKLTASGHLRYSTRQAEVGEWLDILLDYSTDLEHKARQSTPRFDPMTGKPLGEGSPGGGGSGRPGPGGRPG